jgi:preprotein translocase subunit YajC
MDNYMGFILIALLFVVFYFMLIRPQQKRMRQQMELISSLRPGDDVMTSSGIYGTIEEVEEETVLVEISEDVQIRMAKSAIARVFKEPTEEEPTEEEPVEEEAVEETAEEEATPEEEEAEVEEPKVSGEASNDGKKK